MQQLRQIRRDGRSQKQYLGRCRRGGAHFYGKIDNRPEAIRRLISALAPSGQRLHYCYEAGPCGYGICRQIRDTEHDCDLVAPSLTPRKSGDRVKTDRRDGLNPGSARSRRLGVSLPGTPLAADSTPCRNLSRVRFAAVTRALDRTRPAAKSHLIRGRWLAGEDDGELPASGSENDFGCRLRAAASQGRTRRTADWKLSLPGEPSTALGSARLSDLRP